MGCAELVGIQSSLRYFEIIYRLPFESPLWTHEKTVIISLTAPFVSLIAGSLLLFFVLKKVNVESIYKLFVFWIGFQSINFFFGGVIAGSVTGRGLGYALDMAFWPHIMIYFTLIAICIFFLILLGYNNSGLFLKVSPSFIWIKRRYRKQYIFIILLLPCLIGSSLLYFIKRPDQAPQHVHIVLHDAVQSASMILLLLPMFVYDKLVLVKIEVTQQKENRKAYRVFLILTIVLLLVFRILLSTKFYIWINR